MKIAVVEVVKVRRMVRMLTSQFVGEKIFMVGLLFFNDTKTLNESMHSWFRLVAISDVNRKLSNKQ